MNSSRSLFLSLLAVFAPTVFVGEESHSDFLKLMHASEWVDETADEGVTWELMIQGIKGFRLTEDGEWPQGPSVQELAANHLSLLARSSGFGLVFSAEGVFLDMRLPSPLPVEERGKEGLGH